MTKTSNIKNDFQTSTFKKEKKEIRHSSSFITLWNTFLSFLLPQTGIDLDYLINPKTIPNNEETILRKQRMNQSLAIPFLQFSPFFEIIRKLSTGGFGDIYIAKDKSLEREVVVKTLQENKQGKNSERSAFITEARITALLSHPNIVPIYGIFTDETEQNLYLVMKQIHGKSLTDHLASTIEIYDIAKQRDVIICERRQFAERLEIFLKICDAISYAHYHGVLHRDLKPDNIMIDEFNETYVMDWGISEIQKVKTSSIISPFLNGTLLYMAPEILTNEFYDSRSDIYSLGIILFEMTFLKKAFEQNEHLAGNIIAGKTVSFEHIFNCYISNELKRIIIKAINPSPEERYQTVKLLSDDLRRYIRGEHQNFFGRILNFFH